MDKLIECQYENWGKEKIRLLFDKESLVFPHYAWFSKLQNQNRNYKGLSFKEFVFLC